MDKIKLAIIGAGMISDYHVKVFEELKDKIEVVGTCAKHIENAERVRDFLGAKYATADYKELFDVADSFLVALPHDLHYPVGMDIINAGKHCLMEKPLALNEEECLNIIHAANENNVKLMIGYIMRFHPMVVKLKELIDNKTYGNYYQMSIWTEQYEWLPEGHWLAMAKPSGGGQFYTHGCHYIDLMLWMMGRPKKGAHMGTRLCTEWIEMEGTSNAMFEFEQDRLAYHFGTWGAKGTRHSYCIHTFFEDGMVECCLNDGEMWLHQTRDPDSYSQGVGLYSEKSDAPQLIFTCDGASHMPKGEIEHFADCVINDKPPLCDGPGALQGNRVIWRMYEAADRNIIADLSGLGLDEEWDKPGLYKIPDTKGFVIP